MMQYTSRIILMIVLSLFYSPLLLADDTQLQLYRPYADTDKHPAPVMTKTLKGYCTKQSQRIQREHAWRCSADQIVYDPCFMNPAGSQNSVLCPPSPWDNNSIHILVPFSLDSGQHKTLDMSRASPWALELKNGDKCIAVDAGKAYDHLPVTYHCVSSGELIGHVQRCETTWTILQRQKHNLEMVDIAKAWF